MSSHASKEASKTSREEKATRGQMALTDTKQPNEHKTSFEESIQRLSKIVEQLEGGELPLEESLSLFEEGIRLTRQSQARLDAAERRIEELLAVTDEGEPMTRPMTLRDDDD